MPHMTVSTSLTSCGALYEEQPMPKMHVSNNHSDHSFSAENDNKTSISSVKIDIEVSDFSSTENFGAKDVGNPKLTVSDHYLLLFSLKFLCPASYWIGLHNHGL